MLPKILTVTALPNHVLEVKFDDGVIKHFSVRSYLDYTVYKPLRNQKFFETAIVKYNTIVWGKDEAIDFDSATVYMKGIAKNANFV